MLTNASFWLQLTMKYMQILMNLKLKAVKKKDYYNYFHNILKIFDVLANFLFTTSEMMRDYYL